MEPRQSRSIPPISDRG